MHPTSRAAFSRARRTASTQQQHHAARLWPRPRDHPPKRDPHPRALRVRHPQPTPAQRQHHAPQPRPHPRKPPSASPACVRRPTAPSADYRCPGPAVRPARQPSLPRTRPFRAPPRHRATPARRNHSRKLLPHRLAPPFQWAPAGAPRRQDARRRLFCLGLQGSRLLAPAHSVRSQAPQRTRRLPFPSRPSHYPTQRGRTRQRRRRRSPLSQEGFRQNHQSRSRPTPARSPGTSRPCPPPSAPGTTAATAAGRLGTVSPVPSLSLPGQRSSCVPRLPTAQAGRCRLGVGVLPGSLGGDRVGA